MIQHGAGRGRLVEGLLSLLLPALLCIPKTAKVCFQVSVKRLLTNLSQWEAVTGKEGGGRGRRECRGYFFSPLSALSGVSGVSTPWFYLFLKILLSVATVNATY